LLVFTQLLSSSFLFDRKKGYGLAYSDRSQIPRGPRLSVEPEAAVFDLSGRSQQNYVQLRCAADAHPAPVYEWFKEEFSGGGEQIARKLDPLLEPRLTLTDGTLTIHNPQQQTDRGKYHCRAGNRFGWTRSRSAQLSFGFIGEFSKKRSADHGRANWGKSISCDAPQHHPPVHYYWAKNAFPAFVEEDQRVFVSHDGNLYFSALEIIDRANYSCNVQSLISSTGRTGPFFSLQVEPSPNKQKLLFPNNFPKAFPEAPLAGKPVRLECIAFGYPVPTYNWTRKAMVAGTTDTTDIALPVGARITSHGRVLQLDPVQVEDSGEYVCSAASGRDVIAKSITLAVQALPRFHKPLTDRVMEPNANLQWTCEAFAIPSAEYEWYRDGEPLRVQRLSPQDANRYRISANHLSIERVQIERDQGVYQCRATNQLGAAFTSGQLRVALSPPLFRASLTGSVRTLVAGEQLAFTIPCEPEALPMPDVSWRREGVQIVLGGKYRLAENGRDLLVNPLNLTDSGEYTCRALNELGSAEHSIRLQVLSGPRLRAQPAPRVLAVVGDMLELPCDAWAADPLDLAYVWMRNGREITLKVRDDRRIADGQPQRGLSPGYLQLPNVTFADTGVYSCLVRSAAGQTRADTHLLVAGPPDAPGALQADQVTATSARLSWMDGAPNGRQVLAYDVQSRTNHKPDWHILARYVTSVATEIGSGRRTLQLNDMLSPFSGYEFRVAAINELGVGRASAASPLYHTQRDRPHRAPTNLGGGGGKGGTLTVTWDPLPPESWHSPSVWYRLHFRSADVGPNVPFEVRELQALGNVGSYTTPVPADRFFAPYEVRVQAINEIGAGPMSETSIVHSAESMPQSQPSAVRVEPFNATALKVSWAPADTSRERMRGRLVGHRIKYWRNGRDAQQDALTLLSRGRSNHGFVVALLPNTEYYVSVMAYNDAGSGPESEPALGRTYKSSPLRPPVNVQVSHHLPLCIPRRSSLNSFNSLVMCDFRCTRSMRRRYV
jgi:hypothetical protein